MTEDVQTVQQAADDRARRAGVVVRELTPEQAQDAADLLARVWRHTDGQEPLEAPLLIALAYAGNYCVGAFDGDRIVGVCVAFFGAPIGVGLHSHIAGVHPDYLGRGVGAAIKMHQRAWCADRGISEITWTFDPLASRNAWFNLGVLRAEAVEYLEDFYGQMNDGINAGHGSDRLLIRWPVAGPATPGPGFGRDDETVFRVLTSDSAGEPIRGGSVPARFTRASIAIPQRIDDLREKNPQLARRWRSSVRRGFVELLGAGWQIVGFERSGAYLLQRP